MKAAYRLTFGGTRATKTATSLRVARADMRYWLDFGQKRVCIQKRMLHGWKDVECRERRHRRQR